MNRLLTILLLLGATAHGQINNPPTSVNIVDSTATGRAVLTATNAAAAATAIGLGATNNVTFSNITASGTLGVSNAATFATNVTVNGNISVGSLTTTTPSTWALDATQTAAATNGRLTLPSNANVIRLTNNNAISSVTNGVLGAFYFVVNQATNAVTISNVGGITIDGAQNLTLSPNESATIVATGPTNVSVAGRGDLTDVALGGTLNIAPAQTASSADSLMTRELVGQEFANPRTKMQRTYWFGLEGLGEWSLIGSGAVGGYGGASGGIGGGQFIYSSQTVGTNHAGAALRLGSDTTLGTTGIYRFSDGGALTMRVRMRKGDTISVPAIAFVMGQRTATEMWQQNAYGIYFVPQPTNAWTSNAVVALNDRIAVSNVVWSVNTAGTNGATAPTWTDLIGSLVTNGSAVYRNLGPHTSNNYVLAIGSTNASQVVMTNTGKAGPTVGARQEIVLKLRIDGTTSTPYTVYGTAENSTGESSEVSLTTTNNDSRQPQIWSRPDNLGTRTNSVVDMLIRYFSVDGVLNPL